MGSEFPLSSFAAPYTAINMAAAHAVRIGECCALGLLAAGGTGSPKSNVMPNMPFQFDEIRHFLTRLRISREGPVYSRCTDLSASRPCRYALGDERAIPANILPMDIREVTSMHQNVHHDLAILRLPQVELRTGLSRSTLYQYMKDGYFPKPVPLGRRAVGWLESDVCDWIASRVRMAGQAGTRPTR